LRGNQRADFGSPRSLAICSFPFSNAYAPSREKKRLRRDGSMALLRRKWFFDPAICSLSIPDGGYQSSMTQKRYRFFLFVLLLFLCLSPLFASEPVRIFWVTDNHLKYGDSALEARLEWFIDEVNDKRPDIVIHTGDAIDGKRGRALALKEIDRFAHYWDRIPDSVLSLFVPGNRDIGSAYETTELDWLFLFPSTQETAGSFFNRIVDYQKGDVRLRFILLCDFSQTLDRAELDCWLADALSAPEVTALFVLAHSPSLYSLVVRLLETSPTRDQPVYFLHGHWHGGLGMTLQEEDSELKVSRFLLGGLQDGYYGAV